MAKNESKQEMVVRLVKDGLYTRKEILYKVDCTSGALASYLNAMRNAAKFTGAPLCPVEVVNEEGEKVFVAKTFEEAEALKADRPSAKRASKKTPWQQYVEAEKRAAKSQAAYERAKDRLGSIENPTQAHNIRLEIARLTAELHIFEFQEMERPEPDEIAVDEDVDEDADEDVVAEDELV